MHRFCGLLAGVLVLVILNLVSVNTNCEVVYGRMCLDTRTGKQLYIGEAYDRVGECTRVQCLGDYTISESTCNVPRLAGNCTPKANSVYDPYPRCCPSYVCRHVSNDGNYQQTIIYDHNGNVVFHTTTFTKHFVHN